MAASNRPAQAIPGSTWIAPYQKKKWPVVICDANTVPPPFMRTRSGPHALPAVLLGRHMYVWVDEDSLQEWIPNHDYLQGLEPFEEREIQNSDSLEVTMEKQRRTGFRTDVFFLKDHKYWHNYMVNQSEARKAEIDRRNKHSSSRPRKNEYEPSTPRKSKRGKNKKREFATEYDSDGDLRRPKPSKRTKKDDDDDDDCIIVNQPSPPRPRRTMTTKPMRRRRLSLVEEPPIGAKSFRVRRLSTPEESPLAMKSRRMTARSRIIISSDSDTDGGESEIVVKASFHSKAVHSKTLPKSNEPEQEGPEEEQQQQVKILFSPSPSTHLQIPKSSLSTCKFLRERLGPYSPSHNSEIIPLESDTQTLAISLTFEEMHRLLPYFHSNDIGPLFIHPKTHPHPFGHLGARLKTQHSEFLGLAFLTASKIAHQPLQALLLAKLRALSPLPDRALLTLTHLFNTSPPPTSQAGTDLGSWVINHIVSSYSKLSKNFPGELQGLLEANPELKGALERKLGEEIWEEGEGGQEEMVPARKKSIASPLLVGGEGVKYTLMK